MQLAVPEGLGGDELVVFGPVQLSSIRRSNSVRLMRTRRPIRMARRYPWLIQFRTVWGFSLRIRAISSTVSSSSEDGEEGATVA